MSTSASMTLDLFEAITEPAPPLARLAVVDEDCPDASSEVAPRPSATIHPAMREILGGAASSAFERAFRHIDIAEASIRRFARKHPAHAATLNRAFLALRWQLGESVRDELFQSHVDELLQRVIDKEDLMEGTRAEVLIALSDGSLRGPMVRQYGALTERLFLEIFGPEALPTSTVEIHEPWPGASKELLCEVRRRIRIKTRRLKEISS